MKAYLESLFVKDAEIRDIYLDDEDCELYQTTKLDRLLSLFNQITILYNKKEDFVVTCEYSDNTGSTYYKYYSSIKEYNNAVIIEV